MTAAAARPATLRSDATAPPPALTGARDGASAPVQPLPDRSAMSTKAGGRPPARPPKDRRRPRGFGRAAHRRVGEGRGLLPVAAHVRRRRRPPVVWTRPGTRPTKAAR